jgi:hypothetical protein
MEDVEQLSFWTEVKIETEFKLKLLEGKLLFIFGPNLMGVQTSLEKSDKFSKILICLDLPDY